ncbi:putative uncharacterized protein PQLC2L [Pteropus alecto]|uniref:putative uncharacterized protein PQLC2L n=1 Tax=Pteropus alecto TaxID=9402 RepID=UPI000768660F|nr:putative uncharacterized protein PQLC2L [Pteropus alecto]
MWPTQVEKALSLGFLLCLIGRDLKIFTGCYLANRLPLQIFTATFRTNQNVIMLSQFMYYKLKNLKEKCKICELIVDQLDKTGASCPLELQSERPKAYVLD